MSVTVLQGTFDPLSTKKARDLRQAWVGAFSGVSGWTIEDHNYVNGTSERSVISNDATGFALMLYNSTTTSDLRMRIAFGLGYSTATHILSNLAFSHSAVFDNNVSTNALSLSGIGFNPTSVTSEPDQLHGRKSLNATASMTDWTVHISNIHETAIMTMNTGDTNVAQAIYFGEYESLIQNPALTVTYPYACSIVSSLGYEASGIIESVGNPNTTLKFNRFSTRNIFIEQVGGPAKPGLADYYSSTPTESRVSPIWFARESVNPTDDNREATTIEANLYGWMMGKYYHIVHARPDQALWGETVDVDGKVYMLGGKKTTDDAWLDETWWVEIGDSES